MIVNRQEKDTTALIQSVWSRILDTDQVDIDCNFFDAGGSSRQITQLATELETIFGFRIPVVDLFQYTNVASLAGYLDRKKQE